MDLDLATVPEGVSKVLDLAGWPTRRMGLLCEPAGAVQAESALRKLSAGASVLAGLWLYCGRFEESHSISQELHTAEGSYWHGILHRQEPDDWNAGYWFKRVGKHAIFEDLSNAAQGAGYSKRRPLGPCGVYRVLRKCASRGRREGATGERSAADRVWDASLLVHPAWEDEIAHDALDRFDVDRRGCLGGMVCLEARGAP